MSLVFVHGWAFDAGFWDPVRTELDDLASAAVELGFRGRGLEIPNLEEPLVAIGHSLGFLWLLHERPFPWTKMIAVNGFPRFVDGGGFTPGVPAGTVEGMIAGLDQTPSRVVENFLALCGGGEAPDDLNPDRLRDGLNWLLRWDARAAMKDENVYVLAGRGDPIVPEAMTEHAFAGRPIRWHGGGHLLPLTDPKWCANKIRECLAGCGAG